VARNVCFWHLADIPVAPGNVRLPEGWAHFLEMAQTWEMLADLHELTGKLKASGALLTKPTLRAE
jgi:hypothetical protein